ncbi:actin-like [Mercenaria mercenaria]|uniref:actin-like n=1 Tax=Mercenaria mercenaria TaxID=6596 RepID=UPI00234EAAB1|nr:actin-like [Mercenaria mercenaria]XP_053391967.1 actin-like [Mercenaria mercenaria]
MSDIDDNLEVVVIDNGTWMIKAGYAGDKTARAYERTVIGTDVAEEGNSQHKDGVSMKLFGDRTWFNRKCKLTFPMHRGSVCGWDDMESIWEYIFTHELRDGIEGRPILITEVPGNSPENRQKMVEIMMEKFRVPALYIKDPAGLALISSGRISGIVLDVGGSVTHVTAIHQGSLLNCNGAGGAAYPCRSDIGGNDVTEYLSKIIGKSNFEPSGHAMVDIEGLKHCLYNYTMSENKGTDYSFPDGTSVPVDEDMISCGDILFHPDKIGSTAPGIDKLLCNALHSCEDDIKKELLSNIIISGGTTLTPGVVERLETHVKEEFGKCDNKICVIGPPERRKSSWLGGSIVASLEIFPKICKTREDYTEKGCTEFTTFAGFETFLIS